LKRKTTLTIPLLLCGALSASNALAFDAEYYTYNGFDAVLQSWQLASALFNNNVYNTLFFPIAVMSLMFAGAFFYFKIIGGGATGSGGMSMLSWIFPILIGIVIYLALFVPKGTLTVYDPVMNKFQPVSGIPNAITATAGILNKIERGLVDLINASGPPISYYDDAGGIAFDVLGKTTKDVYLHNPYLDASISQYTKDCVMFELNRPGTTLLITDIENNCGGSDIWTNYAKAANPAVQTVYYDGSNQTGLDEDCATAYGQISTDLADNSKNTFTDIIKERCGSAGFNTHDATELTRCQDILGQSLQFTTGTAITAPDFVKQVVLAQKMHDIVQNGTTNQAVAATANVGIMSSTLSMGLVANEYLPIIRALITCVAVALMPFLTLFLPTPAFGKALGLAAGFFVWLTAWGITDCITQTLATGYANSYFNQALNSCSGYSSIMSMPSAADKTLGLFGMLRMAGLVIASVVSTALIPMGAHAMSMFAGHFAGTIQGQASAAGQVATPEGSARALTAYQGAQSSWAATNRFGQDDMVKARTFEATSRAKSSIDQVSYMGRGNATLAGERSGINNAIERLASNRTTEDSAILAGGANKLIERSSGVTSGDRVGHIVASEENAAAYGFGDGPAGVASLKRMNESGLLDERAAAAVNKSWGFSDGNGPARAGMKLDSGGWGVSNGSLMVTGISSMDGSGSIRIAHGQIVEEGTYNREQASIKADELDRNKHYAAANGLRKIAAGLTEEESIQFRESKGLHGESAKFEATHGAKTDWIDLEKRISGSVIEKHDDVLTSHRRESISTDIDVFKSNKGIEIAQSTAMQRVFKRDASLISPITSAKSQSDKEAAIAAVVVPLGAAMAPFINRTGTSSDYIDAHAKISLGTGTPGISPLKASMDGNAGVGGTRVDMKQVNLMNQQLTTLLINADNEATANSLKGKEANSYIIEKLHTEIHSLAEEYVKNNPDKFGAVAGTTAIKEKAEEMLKKIF